MERGSQTPEVGRGSLTPPAPRTEGLPGAGTGDLRSAVSAGPETRAEQRETRAEQPPPGDPEKRPRSSEKYQREVLNYLCMIHGLPWVALEQVRGLPNPKSISSKLWIEPGYPYQLCIDWKKKVQREQPPPDNRQVIQLASFEY